MILFLNILALGFLAAVGVAFGCLLVLRHFYPVSFTPHWWVLPGSFVSLAWLFAQWWQA